VTSADPTLADRAYAAVEEALVTLRLAPGSVLSEAVLAESIGIGRTPLREALQRLATARLIHVLPRRGMIVAEINLVDFLALLETRRVLDRLVVGGAARRATSSERSDIRSAAEAMERASASGDVEAFLRADRMADQVLEAAAGNPYAVRAAAPLHTHCRRFWVRYREDGDVGRSAQLHGLMLEAVVQGDESAATRASDALVGYLEQLTRSLLEKA
jgi:DNA-binding GntR family transcriptional regulator